MRVLAEECDRRFEQAKVTDPIRSAVAADHLGMNGQHFFEAEKYRSHEITQRVF